MLWNREFLKVGIEIGHYISDSATLGVCHPAA